MLPAHVLSKGREARRSPALLQDRRGSFRRSFCQSLHGPGLWLSWLFLQSPRASVKFRASSLCSLQSPCLAAFCCASATFQSIQNFANLSEVNSPSDEQQRLSCLKHAPPLIYGPKGEGLPLVPPIAGIVPDQIWSPWARVRKLVWTISSRTCAEMRVVALL